MKALALIVACFVLSPVVRADQVTGIVMRVMDGDTVKVREADGTETVVRLEGIDAPESVQRFGPESTAWLSAAIAGHRSST